MELNTTHMDIKNRHMIDYNNKQAVDTAINEGLALCNHLKNDPSISDHDYNVLANNVQYYMYKRAIRELETTQQADLEEELDEEELETGGVEAIIIEDAGE